MTRFSTYASAFVLLTAISSPAFAADINGSTKDTSFGPMAFASSEGQVNWSGFYVGGRIGYGHANHNLTVEEFTKSRDASCTTAAGAPQAGWDGTQAGCASTNTFLSAVAGESEEVFGLNGFDSSGFTGGGQLGYDHAFGRYLVGVFGSYDVSGMETTLSVAKNEIVFLEKGDEWSVGARAGYIVAPRTLAYILAAYTQTDYTFALSDDDGSAKDVTFDGITIGGGVEFALASNIFFGVEGTHTFYGKQTINEVCGIDPCEPGDDGDRLNDEIGETKVLGTLKFKFGGVR